MEHTFKAVNMHLTVTSIMVAQVGGDPRMPRIAKERNEVLLMTMRRALNRSRGDVQGDPADVTTSSILRVVMDIVEGDHRGGEEDPEVYLEDHHLKMDHNSIGVVVHPGGDHPGVHLETTGRRLTTATTLIHESIALVVGG
jgi:hypothetical protein